MPPLCREEGEAGEAGVGENGESKCAGAAEAIADAAEKSAAQCPADQKCGLNPGAFDFDGGVGGADVAEQVSDKGGGDDGVEVHVQPVEKPAEPGGQAG